MVEKGTLKDLLKDKIPAHLLPLLRTSFDIVGDIAIIEIPNELLPFKEEIAKAIISKHKNVKTVLRKAAGRTGEFRLEKLEYVYGEDKTLTLYKENGIVLKVDVANTYFSPRLANERARINSQVKPYENVLVMFSGVGPYVINIARNTKASKVVGIEINPKAHELALENAKLNHVERKVEFYCGDVREVCPKLLKYVVGLKSSFDEMQLKTRLEKNPKVYEFHLTTTKEFENDIERIKKVLEEFEKNNIYFLLHVPTSLMNCNSSIFDNVFLDELKHFLFLVKKHILPFSKFLGVVLHLTCNKARLDFFDFNSLSKIFKGLKKFKVPLFVENTLSITFDKEFYTKLIDVVGIDSFIFDIAHFQIQNKGFDFDELFNLFSFLRRKAKIFFHLSFGTPDGKEGLSLHHNLPFVEKFFNNLVLDKVILEVHVKDLVDADEMLSSYDLVFSKNFFRKFDRIIMPLPKDAPLFLDLALMHVVKGTILHIYNFVPEESIASRGLELLDMIKKYGKEAKLLRAVKAGQFAPGIFRVCYDIEILK